MTVITKPISENKVDKPLEKPLVVNVDDGLCVQCMDSDCHLNVDGEKPHHHLQAGRLHHPSQPGHPDEVDLWTWAAGAGGSARRRRVSATTTVCLFVAALVLLTCAIIGGVYIYRQFTHSQMSRFRGWCGVPFKRNSLQLFRHQPNGMMQSYSHRPSRPTTEGVFNEQFDLDLGSESHEEIFVPDFGNGREGRFVHDFKAEMTGIVDANSERCFVIPLDTSQVVTPRTLFQILRKMWHGFYDGNMLVVRQTLRVVRPPIQDIETTGPYIANLCKDYTTYRLEKVTTVHGIRLRRSAQDSSETSTAAVVAAGQDGKEQVEEQQDKESLEDDSEQSPNKFTVVEFAGKAIIEYTILDE